MEQKLVAGADLALEVNGYLIAERRGFAPGHAEEDWIAAERLVDGR